jgi:hypothetical protein
MQLLKGLCHEMNIFLKPNKNTLVLSVQCICADSFYNFLFLVDEKIKLEVLACSFEITY